jgi:hypothetical protein
MAQFFDCARKKSAAESFGLLSIFLINNMRSIPGLGKCGKETSQRRNGWVEKNATLRAARPDSRDKLGTGSSLRKQPWFTSDTQTPLHKFILQREVTRLAG